MCIICHYAVTITMVSKEELILDSTPVQCTRMYTKCGTALHALRVKNYINVHTGVWPFLLFGVVGGVNSVTGCCTSHLESQHVAKK